MKQILACIFPSVRVNSNVTLHYEIPCTSSPVKWNRDMLILSSFIFGWDSFGPEPIWSPDFRSPTSCPHGQMVPKNSVPMDKWSPNNLVPLDKQSPTNLVPLDKWSPKIWSPWTNGPQPIWSPYFQIITACPPGQQNILGTICPGGPNWLGTICPWGPNFWGPFVHWDRIGWGPFVQRDQLIGDQLWGTKCPGTICVWDQMCHSRLTKWLVTNHLMHR